MLLREHNISNPRIIYYNLFVLIIGHLDTKLIETIGLK